MGRNKPVFVCGAGARSGSTLVQRVVNCHPDAWIWGELGRCTEALLADFLEAAIGNYALFREEHERLLPRLEAGEPLHDEWVAHLSPRPERLRQAARDFLEAWLRVRRIWGFKSVHFGRHVPVLAELFPEARFVVVFRNPYEQASSWPTSISKDRSFGDVVPRIAQAYRELLGACEGLGQRALVLNLGAVKAAPRRAVEAIFSFIGEDVPKLAFEAVRLVVRGPAGSPVPLPVAVRERVRSELVPLYEAMLERASPLGLA